MISAESSHCAACGKVGDGLKTCIACKHAKYCNVTCQKAHRPQHKKACKKRAAELHDEALFKQPPPEECPVCLLVLPHARYTVYQTCCGNTICNGCVCVMQRDTDFICPFCRAPGITSEGEYIEGLRKRAALNDAEAIQDLGCKYDRGAMGFELDQLKAIELWQQAADLGSIDAHTCLAATYNEGTIVERDFKKVKYHWECAAMGGDDGSRYNLGTYEAHNKFNKDRALKHWTISARAGHDMALDQIKQGFSRGLVTKEDFEKTLRAYKNSLDEMKSEQRIQALHLSGENRETQTLHMQ